MKTQRSIRSALTLFAISLILGAAAFAETQNIQEVAVEVNGVKIWLPSDIIVKKGDTVKIHAVNKVPGANSVHGFAIDAYKVQEIIDAKGKDIQFVADKAGVFPIRCQLHPAHVGGQLIVLE